MLFFRPLLATSILAITLSGTVTGAAAADAAAAAPRVALKTSAGEIIVELNAEKAPRSVDNFLQYVRSGQYNGTIFHRVIDGFMIQGGGFDADIK